MDDYLNKLNLRNVENTDIDDYNCGGLALHTFSWHLPYDSEDEILVELSEALWNEEIDLDEGAEELAQFYIRNMLEDFPNLREIRDKSEVREGERLIQFRALLNDDNDVDSDFHFRYYEDGHWWEKCGTRDIINCDDSVKCEDWDYSFGTYNSQDHYLALKMEA